MSINLNIKIDENNQICINGIAVAAVNYVDQKIEQLDLINNIQTNAFKNYSGLTLTNMFPIELDGEYVENPSQLYLISTTNTNRFFSGSKSYYVKKINDDEFHVLLYVESATSTIFETIQLPSSEAWIILKYKKHPKDISLNSDHTEFLYENPLLAYLSNTTIQFGIATYPQSINVSYF